MKIKIGLEVYRRDSNLKMRKSSRPGGRQAWPSAHVKKTGKSKALKNLLTMFFRSPGDLKKAKNGQVASSQVWKIEFLTSYSKLFLTTITCVVCNMLYSLCVFLWSMCVRLVQPNKFVTLLVIFTSTYDTLVTRHNNTSNFRHSRI